MSQAVPSALRFYNNVHYSNDSNVDLFMKTARFDPSVEALQAILDSNTVDVDVQDGSQFTALHHAVEMRGFEKVELLLARKADVSLRDHGQHTALMKADKVAIAKLLLSAKADLDAVNCEGRTALMMQLREPEVARLLIEGKADLEIKDDRKMTALMYWVRTDNRTKSLEVVKDLLDKGASVHEVNETQQTSLMLAVQGCNTSISRAADHHEWSNAKESDPILKAIFNSRLEMIDRLLSLKVDVTAKDIDGESVQDYLEFCADYSEHDCPDIKEFAQELSKRFGGCVSSSAAAAADPAEPSLD